MGLPSMGSRIWTFCPPNASLTRSTYALPPSTMILENKCSRLFGNLLPEALDRNQVGAAVLERFVVIFDQLVGTHETVLCGEDQPSLAVALCVVPTLSKKSTRVGDTCGCEFGGFGIIIPHFFAYTGYHYQQTRTRAAAHGYGTRLSPRPVLKADGPRIRDSPLPSAGAQSRRPMGRPPACISGMNRSRCTPVRSGGPQDRRILGPSSRMAHRGE